MKQIKKKAPRMHTPPAVAEGLGVDPSKVRGWVDSGELKAVNVAARLGGRPRWRIAAADLDAFLESRRSPTPVKPQRRRQRQTNVIEFF